MLQRLLCHTLDKANNNNVGFLEGTAISLKNCSVQALAASHIVFELRFSKLDLAKLFLADNSLSAVRFNTRVSFAQSCSLPAAFSNWLPGAAWFYGEQVARLGFVYSYDSGDLCNVCA